MMNEPNAALRNIAIIAHVDHGKTTLVDQILKLTNTFQADAEAPQECILDSNDLERERGITILAKNISVVHRGVKINVIDTPGHSDFGGQVERVLKLADGVLLLVDAAEGPMPQTRFVLDKALRLGLKPIVVVNKVDKPAAQPDVVHDQVFDLFVELGATDTQLDFPMLYASGRDGWATRRLEDPRESILPLLDAVLEHIPPPPLREGPLQMQVATLDYNDYVGRIGIGRVYRGTLDINQPMVLVHQGGSVTPVKIRQLMAFVGLERREVKSVACGDLCAVAGIEGVDIGDTLAAVDTPEGLPPIAVDAPTIAMIFRINDSPGFGQDGKYVTSRHIRERLAKEIQKDVALRVEELAEGSFKVSGRGVLHLSILIENMRREGYELTVSKPHVIFRVVDDVKCEPIETLIVDTPESSAGPVIELVGQRRGEIVHMQAHHGRQVMEFRVPTRGLIGLRTKITTVTSGEAIMNHLFLEYAPYRGEVPHRTNGVMISMDAGKTVAYALDGLQARGAFFVGIGEECYPGMIVGEHCKDKDIVVNVQRGKKLTNIRAAGADRKLNIAPPVRLSLEEALEYIDDDELVEVTPKSIRLRKLHLDENERKRRSRAAEYDY